MKPRIFALLVLGFAVPLQSLAADSMSASGAVVDQDGKPVAGIKVFAVTQSYELDQVSVKSAAVSGSDGRFEFRSLPKTRARRLYHLIAFRPDEYLGWAYAAAGPSGTETGPPAPGGGCLIKVSKPGIFEGRVVDTEGNPIPGTTVTPGALRDKNQPSFRWNVVIPCRVLSGVVKLGDATTDENGVFRLSGIPAHMEPLPHVTKPGYAMERRDDRNYDPGRLVLVQAGSIEGVLVNKYGKGIPRVSIAAHQPLYHYLGNSAETAQDGSYVIGGLLPGEYYVKLGKSAEVADRPMTGVYVRAGETTKVRKMVATSGIPLSGRVVDADTGKPINNGRVIAYESRSSEATYMETRVDKVGRYSFRVWPGEFSIYFHGSEAVYKFMPDSAQVVTVPPAGLKDLVIKVKRAAMASGKLVDPRGIPLAGVTVDVNGGLESSATTDRFGKFRIVVPPRGKVEPA